MILQVRLVECRSGSLIEKCSALRRLSDGLIPPAICGPSRPFKIAGLRIFQLELKLGGCQDRQCKP